MSNQYIEIKGARVNNLKNIDLKIERNKLIVITGLSGSGKSSLAFDTLYAEGQRRYVESLSAYARQFLGRINKPETDYIKGIPPAIAIEQKVCSRNPRSTVGTSTEIYDYLKLLFARIGKTYSPVSGQLVKKHSVQDVVDYLLTFPENARAMILAPVTLSNGRTIANALEILKQQGFSRVEVNDEIFGIDECSPADGDTINIVVDRIVVNSEADNLSRIADSVQTAFFEGQGACIVKVFRGENVVVQNFSNRFEADGMVFVEPTEHLFSFNTPLGACPTCGGFGSAIGIDPDLVIPNKSLNVYEGAIACWRGEKGQEWLDKLIFNADKFDFPIYTPINELTESQYNLLWTGNRYFHGINDFFNFVDQNSYKIQYRVMMSRFRGRTICPDCHGSRLKPEAEYVKIDGYSIVDLVNMPISELSGVVSNFKLDEHDGKVASRLLTEIRNRIGFLKDVGLGYLTLSRLSSTLSGGESQRINLATSLGSSLVGSLYILDEPSIGLHSKDTELLIKVLRNLQRIGNTVVVVEHDEDIIRAADEIIDIGPMAGRLGGEVVFQGNHQQLEIESQSLTAQYLTGKLKIKVPEMRRKWRDFIGIEGACENNLKNINVKFPLGTITAVTGVSGSGKSTLVNKILYNALAKYFGGQSDTPTGNFRRMYGDLKRIGRVEFVDQNPIGRSTRSNPASYIKAYDEIRKLFADQQAAKIMNMTPSFFSFNVDGGRCEECQGEGKIKIEMQFMADVELVCDSCHGQRFKQVVLDVRYHDKNINDVLNMTVNEAIEFFSKDADTTCRRIVDRLQPLANVGLGYIKLGQSSSSLSGGESQRVKLASFLGSDQPNTPTLFIFDEPTTGLHFHDVNKLMEAFNALVDKGHTVLIIEHNLEVIKCADWVIDLGPDGGKAGGNVVFEGTPEDLVKCEASYTGKYLKEKLL